ncbi:MAG: hypothetical protein WC528_00830 [Patescibacteria group bacterium]
MGHDTFSRDAFAKSVRHFAPEKGPATARAEQKARETGELNPLVDPKGFGVIRRSLPRLEKREDGLWELTVGTPIPIETRVDTTGSMGNNVDIALRVLPKAHELSSLVLPGYDLQIATGIFADVTDLFVLCRPQFEMVAEKIVEQLTLMVPERDGGDEPEDPHYGLFGAAYLTAAHICALGLKGYDFTVSDATAHDGLDERQLRRIFGDEVFEKVKENSYQLDIRSLPTTKEMVQDLLTRAHAFFLQVEERSRTTQYWTKIFGRERVVVLPSTELLPQVQATIIGLTEGTLSLKEVAAFLKEHNVDKDDVAKIARSVANIPIGAQAALPNFSKRPVKGDLFREKTDLWPVDPKEIGKEKPAGDNPEEKTGEWL